MVRPQLGGHGEWNHAWRGNAVPDREEEPGVAELARKGRGVVWDWIHLQLVNGSVVTQHVEFARVVFAEGDDLQGGVGQLLMPCDLCAVVAQAPECAGDPV